MPGSASPPRSSPVRSHGAAAWAVAWVCASCVGCASDPAPVDAAPAAPAQPAWFDDAGRWVVAAEAAEAAAMLCTRADGEIIDYEVRRISGLYDGQIEGAMVTGPTARDVRRALVARVTPLLEALGATHAGTAEGTLPSGERCAAAVGVRRLVEVEGGLPARMPTAKPFDLVARGPFTTGRLYLGRPTGRVLRRALSPTTDDDGRSTVTERIEPDAGEGSYVVELLTESGDDDPQVALLWPFVVGNPRYPPAPAVLFGDAGHPDHALTYRAQALVQRLRTEQEIDVLTVSPDLSGVADARARALSMSDGLGHRRPRGQSPAEQVRADAPGFLFSRLSEVQAQAGTLDRAWRALLGSPAHRFELVAPYATHFGASVIRGEDAAGRAMITLVVLLARRVSERRLEELRVELLGRLNLARDRKGSTALVLDPALGRVAEAQAAAMARAGSLDDHLLGGSVTARALEESERESARVVLAALDDPLRLAPSDATLATEMTSAGIGLSPDGPGGQWMVCVLVATGAPSAAPNGAATGGTW